MCSCALAVLVGVSLKKIGFLCFHHINLLHFVFFFCCCARMSHLKSSGTLSTNSPTFTTCLSLHTHHDRSPACTLVFARLPQSLRRYRTRSLPSVKTLLTLNSTFGVVPPSLGLDSPTPNALLHETQKISAAVSTKGGLGATSNALSNLHVTKRLDTALV